jgi:hypothetical protein
MFGFIGSQIERLGRWLSGKSAPLSLRTGAWRGSNYTDKYKRNREPTPNELIEELKGVDVVGQAKSSAFPSKSQERSGPRIVQGGSRAHHGRFRSWLLARAAWNGTNFPPRYPMHAAYRRKN